MRKITASYLIILLLLTAVGSPASAAEERRGGFMGFIAGCCFGLRSGAAYNDGMEIHWREWCPILPYVGVIFSIWNGVDCANGKTAEDFAAIYGELYY